MLSPEGHYYAVLPLSPLGGHSPPLSLLDVFFEGIVHSLTSFVEFQTKNLAATDRHASGGTAINPRIQLAQIDVAAAADDLELLVDIAVLVVGVRPHPDQPIRTLGIQ